MNKLQLNVLLTFLLLVFSFTSCIDKVEENQKIDRIQLDDVQPPALNQTSEWNHSEPTWQIVNEFYDAISDNNTEKVAEMLETTFPANFQPKNKISPVEAVIRTSDNLSLLKLLVNKGATINDKEENLVLAAAEHKRLEILKYLIEKGCAYKDNGSFNTAGFYQFYEGAKYVLLKGADQNSGDIRGKLWVFYEAVRKSDYEVLNALTLSKNEMSSNKCDGTSALIIAIKENNLSMVKYLLKKGADKNKPETFDCGDDLSYGKLPIEIAKANKFDAIVETLQ